MIKPTLNYRELSEIAFALYAGGILHCMKKNNDIFVEPDPSLEELETRIIAYREGLLNASYRDHRQVLIKNKRKQELHQCLRLLSFYIDKTARGDKEIIVAAGFSFSDENRKPSKRCPDPENFSATSMGAGSFAIRLRVKPWRGCRMYVFECRKKDTEAWETILSSKASCILNHLEHFSEYEFRVYYKGAIANSFYSPILSCYIV